MSRAVAGAALAWVLFAGCGVRDEPWDPAAVITVARGVREAAASRCLVVARGVGPELDDPMPFAVYQGLVTAGFVVEALATSPREEVVLLGFRSATRDAAGFNVATTLADFPETAERRRTAHVRWRVECPEGRCMVVDSTLTAAAEEDEPAVGPLPDGCR